VFKNKIAVLNTTASETANKKRSNNFYCRFPTLVLSRSGGSGAQGAFKGMFSVSRLHHPDRMMEAK